MSDRHNQRNPEEIEADIAQHRERLDETLEELEERFSPQQLINRTFDYVRHGGANEFTANLSEAIKQNPTPFLVTSVGLGWLMWSQRSANNRSQPGNATRDLEGHYPSKPVGATSSEGSRDRDRMGAAKEKARHMSDSAKGRAQGMSDGMRERTSRAKAGSRNAMHNASSRAQSASQQTTHFIQEHPVMAGALGIAIGAAIGSLLPSTRTEDERMGAIRDKAVDRATQEGERYADEARAKVHDSAEKVEESQDTSGSGRTGSDEASGSGGNSASKGATRNSANRDVSGAGGDTASRGSSGSAGTTPSSTAIPPSSTTPGSAAEATEPNTTRQPGSNSDDSRSGNSR